MKKWLVLLITVAFAAAFVLGGCGGKQETAGTSQPKEASVADLLGKSKNLPGLSFDVVMSGQGQQTNAKVAMQGKKVRSEMTVQNMKMISIVDGDANVAYMYNPAQGSAMKISLDKAKTVDSPDRFTKEADPAKYKVVETVTLDGVKCRVLLLEDAESKTKTKMWVREDVGLPARVEVTDANGGTMVLEYKNIKVGAQPADSFQLPAGVKVTDLGEMMKQMPAAPTTP